MKKNYKILVIDSDPTLRLIAESKLTHYGYQVLTAATGMSGIQVALNQLPDLFLLDYQLSDMSGVEVCQFLRKDSKSMDKPILFIAGNEDYQSIDSAFQAGATDFSRKPLNWTILIYRIQYMLRAHEVNLSLLSKETRLTRAQKLAKIANWEYSTADKAFKWSDSIYDLLDINPQREKILSLADFIKRIPEAEAENVRQAVHHCMQDNIGFEIEHEVKMRNGQQKIISHLGNVVKNETNDVFDYIGTLQDITERRNHENKIRALAYYDSLTGLMNRDSFLSALDNVLASNESYDLLSALLFIDLDNFKRVNDTLGHDIGDLLLCQVSERLKKCVRTAEKDEEYDTSNSRMLHTLPDGVLKLESTDINRFDLARLGGDEFTVFLTDIPNEEAAASVAKRLLSALEEPFDLDGYEIYITFSIGIAISPNDGDTIKILLKNADTAMYSAKAMGKNNFQFYAREMNERSLYRLTLEADLRNVVERNELHLVYQPQICLKTGRLIGAEALMRWEHSTQGSIPPVEFIPLAEQTGQILVIGDWLFKQFSEDLLKWKQQGLIDDKFKLALNVSSLQFHQSDMMNKVKTIFSDLELNGHVEFELTESVMMKNAEENLVKLNSLSEHNITLSIDDFGTGYSSLSYLHRFPVDTVKIDRSFISNMENDGQVNIVKAIIAMAHGMNIKVVAEGIENQWQYNFLKKEGCDIGQGYFISKPISTSNLQLLLEKENFNFESDKIANL